MAHDKLSIQIGLSPNLGLEESPQIYQELQLVIIALHQMEEKINELVEAVNALETP